MRTGRRRRVVHTATKPMAEEKSMEVIPEQKVSNKCEDKIEDEQLKELIEERYNKILYDLATQDNILINLKGILKKSGAKDDEVRAILKAINDKTKLWLEYFVATATFRNDSSNLFEYLDSFNETQNFIPN